MPLQFIEREGFQICGYSVETTLAESENDVGALLLTYESDRAAQIDAIATSDSTGIYGLMWYTQGHERYRYLVGKEVQNPMSVPSGAELKQIPKSLFAVASYPRGYDNTKAWTEFFFTDIPEAGYAPDYANGYFFEYYPNGMDGDFELWTPVIKE